MDFMDSSGEGSWDQSDWNWAWDVTQVIAEMPSALLVSWDLSAVGHKLGNDWNQYEL